MNQSFANETQMDNFFEFFELLKIDWIVILNNVIVHNL